MPESEGHEEHDPTEEELLEEGALDSSEEGFMKGYSEQEEAGECAECGVSLRDKKTSREIDGEDYYFCSKECAKEFEETLAKEQ